jgi:hypothetical protein
VVREEGKQEESDFGVGMEKRLHFFLSLLSLLYSHFLCSVSEAAIGRDDFPPGFIFGAGASAYQVPLALFFSLSLVV